MLVDSNYSISFEICDDVYGDIYDVVIKVYYFNCVGMVFDFVFVG